MLRRAGNWLIGLVLLLALVAGVGSLVLGRPVLATIIRSGSMSPVYERGDVAFLWNWPGEIREGDIILFKPVEGALAGDWTMHRVVGLDGDGNFLTQGDAARSTDQHDRLAGPVEREQIHGKALLVGATPVKLPWVGTWALRFSANRTTMQQRLLVAGLVMVVLLGAGELTKQGRRRRRGEEFDFRLLCIGIGAILTVLLVSMTMYQTIRVTLIYDVGEEPGLVYGEPDGTVTLGQELRKELATLHNRGFFPALLLVSENDPNITPDVRLEMLGPRQQRRVHIDMAATVIGSYSSLIEVSLVFPLLPARVIGSLAKVNHWLGALAGCVWPGLAVAVVGLAEPSSRRRTARELRQWRRKLALPF